MGPRRHTATRKLGPVAAQRRAAGAGWASSELTPVAAAKSKLSDSNGQRSFSFQESTVTQATEGRDSDSEDKDLLKCQNASDPCHITSVMKYHQCHEISPASEEKTPHFNLVATLGLSESIIRHRDDCGSSRS
jgi:hypothetical protein